MAIIEDKQTEDPDPVRFTPPMPGPWSPTTKLQAGLVGMVFGIFCTWVAMVPRPEPGDSEYLGDPVVRAELMERFPVLYAMANGGETMNDHTDIRDFFSSQPMTVELVRIEDKITELKRELELRRTIYPIAVRKGRIKNTEAASRIAILKAILADYESQAEYANTAERMGEKE